MTIMKDFFEKNKSVIVIFLVVLAVVIGILLVDKIQSGLNTEEIIINDGNSEETGTADTTRIIRVDVSGAVKSPGVYEFEGGKIVEDAILAAGGLSDEANFDFVEQNINRAKKLVDGEKIYIPKQAGDVNASDTTNQQSLSNSNGKININTALLQELDSLPGIGPSYAQKIIESRPYSKIEDIKKVKGIGDSIFEKIKDKISV